MWSTILSKDISGIYLQTQNCMENTSWEQTGVPDQRKRIYRIMQNSVGWRNWGRGGWRIGVFPTCPWQVGELEQGSHWHIGAIVWVRGKTFKAKSETANLWWLKWNENQIVLAAAIHTLDRDTGVLEGIAAGSWNLGIVEQSQGKGCCWLWRDRLKGGEEREETVVGNACGGKQSSHGSKVIWLSHT